MTGRDWLAAAVSPPALRPSGGRVINADVHTELTRNPRGSLMAAAEKACRSLAIASGFEQTPAELRKHIEQLTAQDACLRKHGVPNMPGPDAQGGQTFPSGVTPRSPVFQAAARHCAYLNP